MSLRARVGRLEGRQDGPCRVCREGVTLSWTDDGTDPPAPPPCPVCGRPPMLIIFGYYGPDDDAGCRVHPAE